MSARDELIEIVTRDPESSGGDEVWATDLVDAYAAEIRLATLREVRKAAYAMDNAPDIDPYYWGYGGSKICRMISDKVRSAQPGA